MSGAGVLLVVGIHREELAFGQAVAAALDPRRVDTLVIPEGLTGRRPRPDQRFHSDLLHRALYLQLRDHIRPEHRLLIDLHTGLDPRAPCADLYCRDIARLAMAIAGGGAPEPRLVPLGRTGDGARAEATIPEEIWRHPRCLYVGMEIYLREPGAGSAAERDYGRRLIGCLASGPADGTN